MNIVLSIEDIVTWVSEAIRSEGKRVGDVYQFTIKRSAYETPIEISINKIQEIINTLALKHDINDTTIYDDVYYEVLVKEENSHMHLSSRLREDQLQVRDEENKITYTYSKPSDEYIVFLLSKLSTIAPIRFSIDPTIYYSRAIKSLIKDIADHNVFDIIRMSTPRLRTLRIEADRARNLGEFIKFSNSFFFQVSYNLDVSFVPQRYLDELVRTSRIIRSRRVNLSDFEAPKRFYIADLVYHYQLAVASDSAPLEYLSYYHVAEHFFEAVFNDDLIERIRHKITQPDFSYKRKKDVKSLIDDISRSLKSRGETITFSEFEALRLTITKYVNLAELINKLQTYDPSLIGFYKTSTVSFSEGDRIDFEDSDQTKVIASMARRIYKTRNAIVHSKESEKSRYIPFEHDKLLIKEVPLLRFVAELIIIENSTVI